MQRFWDFLATFPQKDCLDLGTLSKATLRNILVIWKTQIIHKHAGYVYTNVNQLDSSNAILAGGYQNKALEEELIYLNDDDVPLLSELLVRS